MQKIFYDTRILDKECRTRYALSEDCMMENAAAGLEKAVLDAAQKNAGCQVFVLCGSGNNGADGYALARRLYSKLEVTVLSVKEPKSEMCKIQAERAASLGVKIVTPEDFCIVPCAIFVDCIFGSGFKEGMDTEVSLLLREVNKTQGVKIACDVPTGLNADGKGDFKNDEVFRADTTVCMGALKLSLFSDGAKDFAGKIIVQDLGVSRERFESSAPQDAVLLDEGDLLLPHRERQNVNKGSFGNAVFICGNKPGAAVIASLSALHFGAGLSTLVDFYDGRYLLQTQVPYEIVRAKDFPKNTSAVAVGMGLGDDDEALKKTYDFILQNHAACVLDADVCYKKQTAEFLRAVKGKGFNVVLTPHPKEFAALLAVCGLGEYSVSDVVNDRLALAKKFSEEVSDAVLVLKGANVLICKGTEVFVNGLGTAALSKAGSGDVLSGMTASLLAQGKSALDAAKNASLAHALASTKCKNDYALTPTELISCISSL